MLIKSKASLEFTRYPAAEKAAFGLSVTTSLAANAVTFPNLPVLLVDLEASTGTLVSAITAAKTGDHVAVAVLANREKAWDSAFRKTANYVTTIANGDESIVLSGGFKATKGESQPAQKPEIPQNFSVGIDPGKGNFNAMCDPMKGTAAYVYTAVPEGAEVTHDNNLTTITLGTAKIYVMVDTHREVHFTNMPGGTLLHVDIYGVNRAGSGAAADTQPVIPQ